MNVGVVGTGVIAHNYVKGSAAFPGFEIVACADLRSATAAAFGAEYGLRVLTTDELLADPDIDLVLSLTPPEAHADVARAAFAHAKHVYTEKPLAAEVGPAQRLVKEAAARGVRLGCAPDTFLGSPYQLGREVIERGDIGEPLGATATFLVGGPDNWHPNADMFYRPGGGPLLDIGPYYLTAVAALLGSFAAATGVASTPTPRRTLGVGPRAGEEFDVDVPTHVSALLELESGALVTLTVSFEAREQYESSLVVYGTEGTLELPDANAFDGEVRLRVGRGDRETLAYAPSASDTRGIGLQDLADALQAGRPHRASGELGLHVLETAHAILRSVDKGRTVPIESRVPAVPTPTR
ncbi:MAG TPA: Gfo/Idh/MocA family oxidoreductase [Gaiellaceae bacterium]|nr:Gfo/Idh/MocA family oxidoreductase [Gaiellaceae bacterium]